MKAPCTLNPINAHNVYYVKLNKYAETLLRQAFPVLRQTDSVITTHNFAHSASQCAIKEFTVVSTLCLCVRWI